MPDRKSILTIITVLGFCLLGAEVYFYCFNFSFLLKDRIFNFEKPDYINYWLLTYISFAVLTRFFGLLHFLYGNKSGFWEYSLGQLMLIALLCKEIFRYTFYVYIRQIIETGNWKTLSGFILLFIIEISILVYFYFASLKMQEE
jgi:hypothetical protein